MLLSSDKLGECLTKNDANQEVDDQVDHPEGHAGPEQRFEQVHVAKELGAEAIELHTGEYANARGEGRSHELARLLAMARLGSEIGLEVHAGHGLTYQNVGPVAAIPEIVELNIGHSIISRAIYVGLRQAVADMRSLMDQARTDARLNLIATQ